MEGQENLMNHITDFYKKLFGYGDTNSVDMNLHFDNVVGDDVNSEILAQFSLEIKSLVFSIQHNKAHGLDDFPIAFYEHFWDII